ncbi:putative zinc-binding metallopeptidase [Niabella beijingensis]|uniref:putative zinc-binding metallopeptidase n=1 Tax=Niabella beijingensis TaxID=2872700 RepID=UPI001CBCB924|nr:putative zinc-binding metallopeptidase [Niabella beijingensis]MBZ4190289.1 putative zinc-binding metallopeptidase [Niabella beijingensis]
MKKIYYKSFLFLLCFMVILFFSCNKETALVREAPVDYLEVVHSGPKNGLDSLIDTIQNNYGVQVYYQFTPRVIDPTTFFTPTTYNRAMAYADIVVRKMWLGPLKQRFPKFWAEQKPIEFLIVGSAIKFNSISSGGAAGAGLNGQFYRLGMGGVDNMSFTRATVREHMCILFHEHAHQMDHKYGRGYDYDRVSQGEYYGTPGYTSRTDEQAQEDGFFRNYGGYAPEEDFATTVEACLRFSKDSIMKIVAKNDKLRKKYNMIYSKYLDMGMDLHEMKVYLDSAAIAL